MRFTVTEPVVSFNRPVMTTLKTPFLRATPTSFAPRTSKRTPFGAPRSDALSTPLSAGTATLQGLKTMHFAFNVLAYGSDDAGFSAMVVDRTVPFDADEFGTGAPAVRGVVTGAGFACDT